MENIIKEQSIYKALATSAKKFPGRVALVYQKKKFYYADVLDKVNEYAYTLSNLGYKTNDVITVSLPNIPQAVYLLYAINQIGAIANLVHPLMEREQLEEIMDTVGSSILFTLDINYSKFASLENKKYSVISVSPVTELNPILKLGYKHINKNKLISVKELSVNKTDVSFANNEGLFEYNNEFKKDSFYLHSGGTTGKSKTIALSSYALNALVYNAPILVDTTTTNNKHMLAVLPMFHGFGLCMGIHAMLSCGGCNTLMPKFSSDECVKYVKKNQLAIIIGVPTLYEALLKNPGFYGPKLKNLEVAFVGGDFVSDDLVNRFNDRMKEAGSRCRMYQGYGLTETVTVLSVNTHFEHKDGTVGKVLPNVKVKTCDIETHDDLPLGEPGELFISGETLMNGYRFENESANDKVFFVDDKGVKWVKTGDYGRVDEDNHIIFMQRLKRIIKVNGINIFPSEVENLVCSLPFVIESAAISVDDEKFGNMIKLFITVKKDLVNKNYIDEINSIIKKQLSVYAVPKEIVILEEFPKTLVGKIDTKVLQ